jgi:ferrochelatase
MSIKKTGVLLVNLGTPDSPKVSDVKKYLREFLNDGRVIDINAVGRKLLVNGIIAPTRGPKSAKEYKKLFKIGEGSSPLLTYGINLTEKVKKMSHNQFDTYLAMRYGNPSMEKVLGEMRLKNYDQIIIFPLYPQYASATTGSISEKAFKIISKWWVIPEIKIMGQFYDDYRYLECVKSRTLEFDLQSYDQILFSYHGIPERHVDKVYLDGKPCKDHDCDTEINDSNKHCYKATCFATTRHLAKILNLKEDQHRTTFQSRLGRDPWDEKNTCFFSCICCGLFGNYFRNMRRKSRDFHRKRWRKIRFSTFFK